MDLRKPTSLPGRHYSGVSQLGYSWSFSFTKRDMNLRLKNEQTRKEMFNGTLQQRADEPGKQFPEASTRHAYFSNDQYFLWLHLGAHDVLLLQVYSKSQPDSMELLAMGPCFYGSDG